MIDPFVLTSATKVDVRAQHFTTSDGTKLVEVTIDGCTSTLAHKDCDALGRYLLFGDAVETPPTPTPEEEPA